MDTSIRPHTVTSFTESSFVRVVGDLELFLTQGIKQLATGQQGIFRAKNSSQLEENSNGANLNLKAYQWPMRAPMGGMSKDREMPLCMY